MENRKKNNGSSLIEVLLALAVVLLVIIALARGVTTAIKSSDASKRGIQAASYAQEGMENVRAFRDAGWTQFDGFVTGNLGINRDFTNSVPSSSNCPTSANILSIFTRCVKFEGPISPDKYKATVNVSWTDGSGTHSSTLVSYFTKSSDWAVNVPTSAPPPAVPTWHDPIGGTAYLGYGRTCQESGVLLEGGQVAGLARRDTDSLGYVINAEDGASIAVTACVRAEFEKEYDAVEVKVLHSAIANVCGDGCHSGFCDSGGAGRLFRSTDSTNWTHVGTLPRQTSLTWTNFALTVKVRYLLVCRNGDGSARENLRIDNVQIKG